MTVIKPKFTHLDMPGRCFIIWGSKGQWNNQGVIHKEVAPGKYLCQFFECLMGGLSTLTILPIEIFFNQPWREPGSAIIFETDEHMRFWIEHVYRAPPLEDE